MGRVVRTNPQQRNRHKRQHRCVERDEKQKRGGGAASPPIVLGRERAATVQAESAAASAH